MSLYNNMFLISNIMELKNAKKKIKMEKESALFWLNVEEWCIYFDMNIWMV